MIEIQMSRADRIRPNLTELIRLKFGRIEPDRNSAESTLTGIQQNSVESTSIEIQPNSSKATLIETWPSRHQSNSA